MIQYDYTQKHIQIVQLTARKCLCSTACSVLTRGFKTQIAIAHLACEQQMTCKVSCTLQILSWFLILYLTDLLGMHPTEGHCWYTLSACLKLRHYKHSKKTMQEGVAHGKSGKLSRPTLICIGNMGKLWPHIAHIHLGHRGKVVCKVENKGSLVDCGAILWPLRSATMPQVHLVAWCFAKLRT